MRPVIALSSFALLLSCGGEKEAATPDANGGAGAAPVFSLAWSEYPSWSTFGVADELGLVDAAEGEMGEIEKKWNVDLVLREADYDTCLTMYGGGQVDAAALTNMDALIPASSRKTVAILPTSTSNGADAVIVQNDITDVTALKGRPVYGLAKTVSEYMFVRNLEILGEDETAYTFTNKDPGAAAMAMQQRQEGYEAIAVWNPFVLETLKKREDVKVLFDSTTIPGEIVDMIVVSQDALDRPGGDRFASVILDTFYAINGRMADPATADETLVALGEKFSNLDLESMKTVVKQTEFYATAAEAVSLFEGEQLPAVMKTVTAFCESHEIVEKAPVVGFGSKESAPGADFRIDATYLKHFSAP